MEARYRIYFATFAVLSTFALLIIGTTSLVDWARYRTPVRMSYMQFVQRHPDEGWYHITGCQLLISEAAFMMRIPKYQKPESVEPDPLASDRIYLPVWADEEPADSEARLRGPIRFLLVTDDSNKVRALKDYHVNTRVLPKQGKKGSTVRDYLNENRHRFLIRGDLEGMVKAGFFSEEPGTRKELDKVYDNRASDCLILEEGDKPSFSKGFGFLLGGLALVVVDAICCVSLYRRHMANKRARKSRENAKRFGNLEW